MVLVPKPGLDYIAVDYTACFVPSTYEQTPPFDEGQDVNGKRDLIAWIA